MYLAYLKFGFGRATTDASIDVRSKKMTRKYGLYLARKLDPIPPKRHLKEYLLYFKMSENKFYRIIENFRNKDIFENVNNKWILSDDS